MNVAPSKGAEPGRYLLHLFVAGDNPNSVQAKKNLTRLCKTHLPGQYQLEISDVLEDVRPALDNNVPVAPALLVKAPAPACLPGVLAHPDTVLAVLNRQQTGPAGREPPEAEACLAALRRGEVDAIIAGQDILLVHPKKAKDARRESEAKYRTLFEEAGDGIAVLDEQNNFLEANPRMAAMLGYSRRELLSTNAVTLIHPDDLQSKDHAAAMAALLRGETIHTQYRLRHKNGHYLFTELSVKMLGPGQFLNIIRDITERKQMEEALRHSEEKFRSVVRQAADGIGLNDEQGIMVEWNRSMEQLTGIPAKEVLGQYVWDVQLRLLPAGQQTPERLQALKQTLQNALQTGNPPRAGELLERPYDHPDGSRRIIQGTIFSIKTAAGFMLASLSRDVTAQREAEKEFLKQVEWNQLLLNTALDGYILADTEGQIRQVNPSYCALTGYTAEELTRMNIRDVEIRLSPEEIEERIEQMVREGRAQFETTHCTKDGRPVELDVSISVITVHNEPLVAAFVRDITGRKQMEAALRESEERYRLLVETSPYAIGVHQDGKVVFANPAAARLLGANSPAGLIGRTVEQIVHPDGLEAALDRIRRMLSGETGLYPTEDRYVRLDGSVVPVEVTAAPFIFQGKPAVQVIALDITARKQAEEELRQYREHLEELVHDRTAELRRLVNLMAGREVRMAELKEVIRQLRGQLKEAGLKPVADDPLLGETGTGSTILPR